MCWTKSRLISDTGTVFIWGPADFSYEAFVSLNIWFPNISMHPYFQILLNTS